MVRVKDNMTLEGAKSFIGKDLYYNNNDNPNTFVRRIILNVKLTDAGIKLYTDYGEEVMLYGDHYAWYSNPKIYITAE